MSQPLVPQPAIDLDTAKAPPTTVTTTPLLPPVPEQAPSQPPLTGTPVPGAPGFEDTPLQYDHLYSDEEQQQIRSNLAAAAARVQKP